MGRKTFFFGRKAVWVVEVYRSWLVNLLVPPLTYPPPSKIRPYFQGDFFVWGEPFVSLKLFFYTPNSSYKNIFIAWKGVGKIHSEQEARWRGTPRVARHIVAAKASHQPFCRFPWLIVSQQKSYFGVSFLFRYENLYETAFR